MTHRRNNSDTFRALSRHENYYLSGGDLFFLVSSISNIIAAAALTTSLLNRRRTSTFVFTDISSKGKASSFSDNSNAQHRLER